MICALCQKPKELRNSHIIPEFLYESLYDDKHRVHVLSVIPEQTNSIEQKGLRERLLCDDCETKFSRWERYASLALKGGVELTFSREGNIVFVGGLDYPKFRLFQLSIIWRAGVSNLPFFKKVRLGLHAEILRQLLVAGDPGPTDRYGCFMFGIRHNDSAFSQVIMQPGKVRLCGQNGYRFMFGGFVWAFLVASHDLPTSYKPLVLCPNGNAVFLIQDALKMEHLASFSNKLIRMGRTP